ncbi:DUF4276 family protein [Desulfococcaceae bacterium HSG8]|nr:DUF4276 family protein [Desulfococcaceae bacterium HSG8]
MVKIRIYVEGGGDQHALKSKCRAGFRMFFEKVLPQGRMPSIIACGSRDKAFDYFCTAIRQHKDAFCVLLVDSEAPLKDNSKRWDHLRDRDRWNKPGGADEEHIHFMVQCMESWFMADKECLAIFFGQGFDANAIPDNPNIEAVSKADIFNGLKSASRNTKTKGKYGKGVHSFDILSKISPAKVRKASEHADILLRTLEKKISD